MAGKVPLVAEGGLAAVTLVGLVTVDLQRMSLERGLLREPTVTLIAEEGSVLWKNRKESNETGKCMGSTLMGHRIGLGLWREIASVGTRSRVQAFVVSSKCTMSLPPDFFVHTAT